MRATMVLMGLALGILFTAGTGWEASRGVLLLDLALGLLSAAAILLPDRAARAIQVAPFTVALTLCAIGTAGFAVEVDPWLSWANITFGLGYLLAGTGLSVRAASPSPAPGIAPHTA